MGEPAPLQPDLPFDRGGPAPSGRPGPPPGQPAAVTPPGLPAVPAWQPTVVEELPPPLTQQLAGRLQGLPWARWGAQLQQAIRQSSWAGAVGRRTLRVGATAASAAMTQGAPYAAALARNTARAGLVRAGLRLAALAVHLVGFPAVVTRTAIQLTVVHRAGLTVESVTYFEARDPAGYVVYQAPADLGTGLAIAFAPTGILMALAIVCLAPTLTPRAALHLPVSLLTWAQIWLGLGFATHALPTHEEAEPLADQARAGLAKAEPLALLTMIPAQIVAWITAPDALLPAALGLAAALWVSGMFWH